VANTIFPTDGGPDPLPDREGYVDFAAGFGGGGLDYSFGFPIHVAAGAGVRDARLRAGKRRLFDQVTGAAEWAHQRR
jgi:hypothetical protein